MSRVHSPGRSHGHHQGQPRAVPGSGGDPPGACCLTAGCHNDIRDGGRGVAGAGGGGEGSPAGDGDRGQHDL